MHIPAIQTITWGDPQHDRFDAIFASVAAAGFAAMEIGYRRLSQVTVHQTKELLAKHQLHIYASHIGGNLADPKQAETERNHLPATLKHLQALKVPLVLYSGLDLADNNELDRAIAELNTLSQMCADSGIALCYHNHDWEFLNSRRIMDTLLNQADDSLAFCPDLGWIAQAGHDPVAFLNEIKPRLKAVHLKDFARPDDRDDTCHLGTGIVDFAEIFAWLDQNNDQQYWVTAEQDRASDAEVACRTNGAFITQYVAK